MLLGLQGCVFSTGPPPSANAWAALGRRATDMVVYECSRGCPASVPLCTMRAGARRLAAAEALAGALGPAVLRRPRAPGPTLRMALWEQSFQLR